MNIEKISFPDGVWEHNGAWRTTLDINDIRDAYLLYIEKDKLKYEIFYEESQYSKEETEELIEKALKNEGVLKGIEEIRFIIHALEEIVHIGKIEPVLTKYKIDEHWEMFRFTIGIEEMEIEYWIALDNENEIYSTLNYKVSKYRMDQIDQYLPKEMHNKLLEEIRKQPMARLRRLYKSEKGE